MTEIYVTNSHGIFRSYNSLKEFRFGSERPWVGFEPARLETPPPLRSLSLQYHCCILFFFFPSYYKHSTVMVRIIVIVLMTMQIQAISRYFPWFFYFIKKRLKDYHTFLCVYISLFVNYFYLAFSLAITLN